MSFFFLILSHFQRALSEAGDRSSPACSLARVPRYHRPARDLPSVSAANVCAEREFLSRLLAEIEEAQPAMIVIDKYFGKSSCDDRDPGTLDLLRTVEGIREIRPVIVGLRTRMISKSLHASQPQASSSYLEESLDFGSSAQSSQAGIVNIARDNRRLPLQWRIFASLDAVSRGETVDRDTLALAASKAYDPYMLANNPMLDRLLQNGYHPSSDSGSRNSSIRCASSPAKFSASVTSSYPNTGAPARRLSAVNYRTASCWSRRIRPILTNTIVLSTSSGLLSAGELHRGVTR